MKAKHIIFLLLLALCSCTSETTRTEMDRLLDRADSLNRAFVPLTNGLDSQLRVATKYYDHHGTSNEQMRAYYLLGCAYRDMGEAPAALQSYQDAVDRADTTSADCDMKRLMSVYGQMAELFHAQNLPTEEIRIAKLYGQLALKEKDTLDYIRNIELMYKPYYLINDSAQMFQVLKEAQSLYLDHGYIKEAKSMNALLAFHQIQNGNMAEVGRLLSVFEEESGLFDKEGNITGGREYYYFIKGQYCQKKDNLAEAEHYYRILLLKGKELLGYKALLSLYTQKSDIDSVKKYALLYEMAMDSLQDNIQTDALLKTSKLYNYQRFKEKAEKEEQQARQARNRLWNGSILVALVFAVCMLFAYQYRKRKKEEIVRLYSDYLAVLSKYNKSTDELRLMKEDTKQYEDAKQQDLEMMRCQLTTYKEQLASYKDQLDSMKTSEILSAFSRSDIVMSFRRKAAKTRNVQLPDNAEWKSLYETLTTEIPLVSTLIGGERILSVKELRVCLLLILGFSNTEIYKLVDLTPQHFSNLKRIINRKLFGDDSAATIENNIKQNLKKV